MVWKYGVADDLDIDLVVRYMSGCYSYASLPIPWPVKVLRIDVGTRLLVIFRVLHVMNYARE